jgi:hypothetical protein
MRQQSNNRRSNHLIEHNGEVHTVSEWARILNKRPGLLFHWVYAGKDIFRQG